MADSSSSARERLVAIGTAMPIAHRIMVGVAVAAFALVAVLFFNWISSPSYSVLASDVPAADLADITTELDRLGVDYRVEAAGTRVMVSRSELGTAKVALSAAGLDVVEGSGRDGYELLDNQGLAVSSNLERINVQRALEGELARTLREFDRIEAANVHLVIPDTGLFGDSGSAEASVIIDVPTDFSLAETDAVAQLVAGAVENLEIAAVSVIDLQGRTLKAADDGTGPASSNGRDVLRTLEFEQKLEQDVTRLLITAGAGDRAAVMVRADLSFDQVESRQEVFEAESATPIRESNSTETFTGPSSAAPGGVAGVDGVDESATETDGTIDYQKQDTATEYGINNVVTSTVQAPGEVESLHVGIVVDDGTITGLTVPTPETLQSLIAASIGVVPERGDTLVVTATPFAQIEEGDGTPIATESAAPASSIFDLIPQVAGALALLIAAVGLILVGRKKSSADDDVQGEESTPALAAAMAAAGELHEGNADRDQEEVSVRTEVIDLVQRQPEDIATLLRGWLAEG
ncbi:MAG: flagellar M-ring protein FliF [Actinomycetia bacterium]|nr:flagellar M-ring protein FliF [Actinomycetes bacterium]MCP4960872.1 flagellar M-ring protein FliF [Actinomycetes bacterium]